MTSTNELGITRHNVRSLAELIDAIGAGSSNPRCAGPVAVEISLGDGRVVTGSYSTDEPQVMDESDVICDDETLRPFVEKLFNDATPLVTQTGSSDTVCTLKWEIAHP